MRLRKKLMAAVLICVFGLCGICGEVVAAEPDTARQEKNILFSGNVTKEFTTWDTWGEAVRLNKNQFDISAFDKPFTMTVDYESESVPILVFFSWTGGPGWAQMSPSFTSKGTAYYTFETISGFYGDDFSLLDAINVMPGGADLTVKEVAFFYEEEEEISIRYRGPAGEIINDINVGWNLGNTLDTTGDWLEKYTEGTPADYETAWGNPVTTKEMIDAVKEAGFNAVRVPVTWDKHIDDEKGYIIDEAWMNRVQEVVDYVIDNDMYCIINLHHDAGAGTWLHASSSNIQKNSGKFQTVWTQIANRFEGYDNKLLFESFNEILDDNDNWSYPGEDGAESVNKLNQLFVDTVRATGGNNAKRVLIVNTYGAGTGGANQESFVVPKDTVEDSLIVQMHCYAPRTYCGTITAEENQQRVWTENAGKATIDGILYSIYYNFTSKGIPVIIGEFGATAKENESDRADYARYMVETAQKYGIRCFWWDNGGTMEVNSEVGYFTGFALYDRYRMEWKYPQIAEAMVEAAQSGVWEVEAEAEAEAETVPAGGTEVEIEVETEVETGVEAETGTGIETEVAPKTEAESGHTVLEEADDTKENSIYLWIGLTAMALVVAGIGILVIIKKNTNMKARGDEK